MITGSIAEIFGGFASLVLTLMVAESIMAVEGDIKLSLWWGLSGKIYG